MNSIYALCAFELISTYKELNISVILKSIIQFWISNKSRKKLQPENLKMAKLKVIEVEQKPHKCPKCKVRFTDRRNIDRHIKKVHENSGQKQKFQCILCKKLYSTKGNHDQHFEKAHMFEHLLFTEPEIVDEEKGINALHIY